MVIDSEWATVDFGATGQAEIIQNVRTILSTAKYSVPLDRAFGLDMSLVDRPLPVAKAQIVAEIISVLQRYEPRIKVTKVLFEGAGTEGVLKPKVQVIFV